MTTESEIEAGIMVASRADRNEVVDILDAAAKARAPHVEEAVKALRFLADNDRPPGGNSRYNAEHLIEIAGKLENSAR